MIESYTFGKMVIDGREYTQDLMILPDGTVLDHWWRESGHVLSIRDLTPIIESSPAILIVGCGRYGMMKPDTSLLDELQRMEIQAKVMPTTEAVNAFNDTIRQGIPCAACFHLTC